MNCRRHLAGHGYRVKGCDRSDRSPDLIGDMLINLLNLLNDFARCEFHSGAKHASLIAHEHRGHGRDTSPPRLLPSGDSAITVEFSRNIDDAANQRALALDRAIARSRLSASPKRCRLIARCWCTMIPCKSISKRSAKSSSRWRNGRLRQPTRPRRWRIPVAYGGEHGIDLEDVAKTLNTTPDDIVARHVAGDYRVAMIGFTPGWSYLSGLDASLHMPRRQNPRLLTPAGTISIGGVQAGVQCLAGPSGWHLLGRTAVRTYQLHRDPDLPAGARRCRSPSRPSMPRRLPNRTAPRKPARLVAELIAP